MLKLVVDLGDEEASPSGFDITYQPLPILQSYFLLPDEVRMADIDKALSYPNGT